MLNSRSARAVKKYVHSRLAPRADQADDIVQDVFLAAWKNLPAYRGSSSFQSWLMGIARNKVKDYYRASLREAEPLESAKEDSIAKIAGAQFEDHSDHLDKELARKKTWEVLQILPERYRIVLIWRYWDECSVKTMAARIGKTEKAAERLLARAREEFRFAWNNELKDLRLNGTSAAQPPLFEDFDSNDAPTIPPAPRDCALPSPNGKFS